MNCLAQPCEGKTVQAIHATNQPTCQATQSQLNSLRGPAAFLHWLAHTALQRGCHCCNLFTVVKIQQAGGETLTGGKYLTFNVFHASFKYSWTAALIVIQT